MKTIPKILIGGTAIFSIYFAGMCARQAKVKSIAQNRALELSTNKGIINLGAGYTRSQATADFCNNTEIKVNVDQTPADCPTCVVIDLETATLPYADKTFDVAFASHVLEHINNWRAALEEWIRISDYQVIVLPSPYFLGGHTSRDHVNFFSFSDMRDIISQYPTVEIYS